MRCLCFQLDNKTTSSLLSFFFSMFFSIWLSHQLTSCPLWLHPEISSMIFLEQYIHCPSSVHIQPNSVWPLWLYRQNISHVLSLRSAHSWPWLCLRFIFILHLWVFTARLRMADWARVYLNSFGFNDSIHDIIAGARKMCNQVGHRKTLQCDFSPWNDAKVLTARGGWGGRKI